MKAELRVAAIGVFKHCLVIVMLSVLGGILYYGGNRLLLNTGEFDPDNRYLYETTLIHCIANMLAVTTAAYCIYILLSFYIRSKKFFIKVVLSITSYCILLFLMSYAMPYYITPYLMKNMLVCGIVALLTPLGEMVVWKVGFKRLQTFSNGYDVPRL